MNSPNCYDNHRHGRLSALKARACVKQRILSAVRQWQRKGVQFRMRQMTCVNPYLRRVFSFSAYFGLIFEKESHVAKWINWFRPFVYMRTTAGFYRDLSLCVSRGTQLAGIGQPDDNLAAMLLKKMMKRRRRQGRNTFSLDRYVQEHYQVRISAIDGVDPNKLRANTFTADYTRRPPLRNQDIVEYFVFGKSAYTMASNNNNNKTTWKEFLTYPPTPLCFFSHF